MGNDVDLFGAGMREAIDRKTGGRPYGEWEFIRCYSTGQLTKLLETIGREFKSRGLVLEFNARACQPGE